MANPMVLAPRSAAPAGMAARVGARTIPTVAAATFRGVAIGGLLVTVLAAGYAGLNLHLATPIGDALIGIGLLALPLALVAGAVRLVAWLAGLALRRPQRAGRTVLLGALVAVMAGLVWLAPEDGPLAMYRGLATFEIPIVTGAIAGGLVGAGRLGLASSGVRRRFAGIGATALAVGVSLAVAAWAVFPGFGDPILREDPAAVAAIAPLDLPDPSRAGPHSVATATYGSDVVWRRPEFGPDADWRTPSVDVSAALEARTGAAGVFGDLLWGHGPETLPMNGTVWYPTDHEGPAPLVLIVHGNHAAGDFSDPGYAYLGRHLASHGMIAASVDENALNGDAFFDYGGREQGVRAWMLLRHVAQFAAWNDDASHPLVGLVDLNRVALVGHSRGGEAAAVAAAMEAGTHGVPGLPPASRGFGIRAVVAIAPSDGQYAGPGGPVQLTDVDYLVIQGAHDGDLPAFTGLAPYHRVSFTGGDHLKVAVYTERANHGRFNAVWDTDDAGPLASWMLDRGSILSAEEQQRLAKAVIGAFLARSLEGRTEYDAFFHDPRAGRAWLPDDVVLTEWATAGRAVLEDFRIGPGPETALEGFDEAATVDPGLRDGSSQGDRALRLRWSGDASINVPVSPAVARSLVGDWALVLSLVAADEPLAASPVVQLEHADGHIRTVVIDEVMPIRPLLPTRLWKLDGLGDRYLPEEVLESPIERFLQTYTLPLSAFEPRLGDDAAEGITAVAVRFSGSGSAYLDDIAFEPGR